MCVHPRSPINLCAVVAGALGSLLGASIVSAIAFAQGLLPSSMSELIGCWQQDIRQSIDGHRAEKGKLIPALEFCFHANGTISGYYVEAGGLAGDLEKSWSFREPSTLLIDDEPCGFDYHVSRQYLTLSQCRYEGQWHLKCRTPADPAVYATSCVEK